MERKLKVLDLFSGIGGFALGLDSTGFFETVKFVEKDKYCQKVLRKNFPNIPIEEDIKNVKGKEYSADVVVGGFPCQPFSVAGKQKGTNDDRYLWPEMLRLIREIKPEFVIGENVQGIINLQNGMVLRQVQDQLESEGFEVQCFLIPASGIGAWHQRYRVWIVGHSQHNGLLAAEKRCRDEKDYGGSQKRENETIEPTRASGSRNDEDLSRHGSSRETPSIKETIISNTNNVRFERDQQTTKTTSRRRTEATSKSSGEDVSNTFSAGSRGEDSRNINEQRRITTQTERKSLQSEDRQTRPNDFEQSSKDVSNTDTRLGIGENEKVQARRETIDSSSSRGGETKLSRENVENPNSGGGRREERSGQDDITRSSEEKQNHNPNKTSKRRGTRNFKITDNVSDTISSLRGGGRTIGQSGENKVWRFYSEKEEQTRVDIRSETVGRNAVFGEKEKNVLHPISERLEGHRKYNRMEEGVPRKNSNETTNSDCERESRSTWWQIESDLCGVPNGISYELDKDRANRIKTLGNAIVPQIAREFGLAIKKVLADEDII